MSASQVGTQYPATGSYTAVRLGFWDRLAELRDLYRAQTGNLPERVAWLIQEAKRLEHQAEALRGTSLQHGRVLEIGSGQCPVQLAYLGIKNQAIGIDLEVVPRWLTPQASMRILRKNGMTRFTKTLARKVAGVDRKLEQEVRRQLGCARMPQVVEMDCARMQFPAKSFDLVFSRAVFEHIADPARTAAEIRRVLKPGGVAIINLHLYTHDTGCHDANILYGDRSRIPYWAHLRPPFKHLVRPNVYINCIRLAQWREIFERELPKCRLQAMCDSAEEYRIALQGIRKSGELEQFTDEELLSITVNVAYLHL